MERAERAALYIFIAGIGVALLAAAGPLAFPEAPKVVWQIIFCFGLLAAVCPLAFLGYEYRHLARQRRMTPLFGMILFGTGFLVCSAWYFWPGQTPPEPTRTTSTPQNEFAGLSNVQLRNRVIDLAKSMRKVEEEFKNRNQELSTRGMVAVGKVKSEPDKNAAWWESTNAEMVERNRQALIFGQDYLPEARELREELERRVGKDSVPTRPGDLVALNEGALAGPSPITDAADYLEKLARKLP